MNLLKQEFVLCLYIRTSFSLSSICACMCVCLSKKEKEKKKKEKYNFHLTLVILCIYVKVIIHCHELINTCIYLYYLIIVYAIIICLNLCQVSLSFEWKIGEIIIYSGRTADVVLPNQWDDVIYANVCVTFLINTRNKK